MEVTVAVSAYDKIQTIRHFVVRPQTKDVEVYYQESDGGKESPVVDITLDIWPNQLSTDEKAAIKKFFKLVAAAAWGVAVEDITGDLIE